MEITQFGVGVDHAKAENVLLAIAMEAAIFGPLN
jgi:hypothetical protein